MNVLEKILEEIEKQSELAHEEMRRCASENPLQFDETKGYARGVEYTTEIIRFHMDEVEHDGQIPVEERLPDKGTYVMCCFDDGAVDVLWQNWKEDKSLLFYADIDGEIRKAIAWQPLPEPYKPKKDIEDSGARS